MYGLMRVVAGNCEGSGVQIANCSPGGAEAPDWIRLDLVGLGWIWLDWI